jgi:polyhydroxyalkanoate synthesis regulator phasin
MNQSDFIKQAIDFNHTSFDSAYDATVLLQDQIEKVATSMLDQASWIPEEGRKAIDNYVDAYKSGRDQYKKYVDESFKKAEEILVK